MPGRVRSGTFSRRRGRFLRAGRSGARSSWILHLGTAMIERLDIAAQHLDIAAGTGEPGLTVARLAPRGHVVLTDLAAEILDTATRRADARDGRFRDQGLRR